MLDRSFLAAAAAVTTEKAIAGLGLVVVPRSSLVISMCLLIYYSTPTSLKRFGKGSPGVAVLALPGAYSFP